MHVFFIPVKIKMKKNDSNFNELDTYNFRESDRLRISWHLVWDTHHWEFEKTNSNFQSLDLV